MTLNCIRWWGSSSGHLRSVEYPFNNINPLTTLTWTGSTCSGLVYGFKNYLYSIGPCWKNIKKQLHKKYKYLRTINVIIKPIGIK